MKVIVNLYSLTNNYPLNILEEFDPEGSTELKQTHSFEIDVVPNDTIKIFHKKISLYLYDLMKNNEHNWLTASDDESTEGRCMFCFQDTVALDPDDNKIIQCETCERIYNYRKRFSAIPLPAPKYLYLEGVSTTNSYETLSPILKTVDEFNEMGLRMAQNSPIVTDNSDMKINMGIKEYSLLMFQDVLLYYQQFDISDTLRSRLTKLFWNDIDYREYSTRVENSLNEITPLPNFIKDNNSLSKLSKELQFIQDVDTEFAQLSETKLLNKQDIFTKINVLFQSATPDDKFVDQLSIFQLLDMDSPVIYASLYIPQFEMFKHKFARHISPDIQEQLKQTTTKQLLIKLNNGVSIVIFANGDIKTIIPPTLKIKETIDIVHSVISKITMGYRVKGFDSSFKLPEISNDISRYGKNGIMFSPLSKQLSFETEQPIVVERMVNILSCLKNYIIVTNTNSTHFSAMYIKDTPNKQGIYYDKFLWETIKQQVRQNQQIDIERLRIDFSTHFDIVGEQLNVLMNQWTEQNEKTLAKILENPNYAIKYRPLIDGVVLKFDFVETFVNVQQQSLKFISQDIELQTFIQKIITLYNTFSQNTFFKKNCTGVSKMPKRSMQKSKNLKLALKRYFPDIFWDASPGVEGYTRKCQKQQQPRVFTDESSYRKWLKEQMPPDLTELQQIFTQDCLYFSDSDLNAMLTRNGLSTNGSRAEKCLRLQMHTFSKIKKTTKILSDILKSLLLPHTGIIKTKLNLIERYFKQQKFMITNNVDNVLPNPQTFVMNKQGTKYYLTCPNGLSGSLAKESKYINFLKLDDHPNSKNYNDNDKRKVCTPCCGKSINTRRVDFCSGITDYSEYINNVNENNDYIIGGNKILLDNRYGHLPDLLHKLLNMDMETQTVYSKPIRTGLVQTPMFFRRGIVQNNFSFVRSVLSCLPKNISTTSALGQMQSKLNEKLFRSLAGGNVYRKYNGSLAKFKQTFDVTNINEIDPMDTWELMSTPGILIKQGMNILVFEIHTKTVGTKTEEELHLQCPKGQELQYFYDANKPSIMLYHHESGEYEPVVLFVSETKDVATFDLKSNQILESIQEWYLDTCSAIGRPSGYTAKGMIQQYPIKMQILNEFNQVIYVITKDNITIPVIPSGMDSKIPYKLLSNFTLPLQSYTKTMDVIQLIKLKPIGIIPDKAIVLDNDTIFPFKGNSRGNDLEVIDAPGLHVIDQNILKGVDETIFTSAISSRFIKQQQDLFKLYFSHFLTLKQQRLIEQSNDNVPGIVEDFIKQRVIIKDSIQPLLTNVRKIIGPKVEISSKYIDDFQAQLIDHVIRYPLKRDEILNKTVSAIDDPLVFQSTKKYIFTN
jgi:hypothetical protein